MPNFNQVRKTQLKGKKQSGMHLWVSQFKYDSQLEGVDNEWFIMHWKVHSKKNRFGCKR